jgi:formylglycine-generating enzyme required for sulfatase activity
MGSDAGQDDERPVHEVEVDGFACAVYPVTQLEYVAFLDATGHEAPREWPTAIAVDGLPVTGVSWLDAIAYCRWHSDRGNPIRLPTEAEWEFAARGGLEGARYPWGDDVPAWLPEGGRGPLPGPWPVALGDPNGYGVFGIGANIHEWCADWHAAGYYAQSPLRNPQGPATGVRRASRGGAWRHAITISRCAQRSKIDPSFRYTDYGFRVVR